RQLANDRRHADVRASEQTDGGRLALLELALLLGVQLGCHLQPRRVGYLHHRRVGLGVVPRADRDRQHPAALWRDPLAVPGTATGPGVWTAASAALNVASRADRSASCLRSTFRRAAVSAASPWPCTI